MLRGVYEQNVVYIYKYEALSTPTPHHHLEKKWPPMCIDAAYLIKDFSQMEVGGIMGEI